MQKKIESHARKKSEDLSYDEVRDFVERSGCLDALADCITKLCIDAKDKAINNGLHNTKGGSRIYAANLNSLLDDVLFGDVTVDEQVYKCVGKFVAQEVPPKSN